MPQYNTRISYMNNLLVIIGISLLAHQWPNFEMGTGYSWSQGPSGYFVRSIWGTNLPLVTPIQPLLQAQGVVTLKSPSLLRHCGLTVGK